MPPVGRPRVGVCVALITRGVLGGPIGVGNDPVEFGVPVLAAALSAMYCLGVKSAMGLLWQGGLAYGLPRALRERLLGVCAMLGGGKRVEWEGRLW